MVVIQFLGAGLTAASAERPAWTSDVESWQLDAAEEVDAGRYYWVRDAVAKLDSGRKAIVIGRKGTGKTAIVRHLAQTGRLPNQQVCNFDLQDFGVFHRSAHDLSKVELETDLFARWQMTILGELGKLMLYSKNVRPEIKAELEEALQRSPTEMLLGQEEVTTHTAGGLQMFGHGLSGGKRSEVRYSPQSLSDRSRGLLDYFCDNVDSSTYFILIDGIDSNYTTVADALGEDYFFAYARALVRAVLSIRKAFASTNRARVYPILAIRSDIYRRISDSDKGKWEDLVIDLRWTEDELLSLADFRVARLENPGAKLSETRGAFSNIYKMKTYHRKKIFSHLCDMSLMRPRDVVNFVRTSFDHSTWPIANAAMPHLFRKQSKYIRQEIYDEAHVAFPGVESMLSAIEKSGRTTLGASDIEPHYFGGNSTPLEAALRLSVQYNILGVLRARDVTFAYQDEDIRATPSATFVVHQGLRPCLGLPD